jgi:K(+)-stimulated pyrophosphate-energized sodium pump
MDVLGRTSLNREDRFGGGLARFTKPILAAATLILSGASGAFAATGEPAAGEASLKLPDLTKVDFLGMNGHHLLLYGILFCFFGFVFGLVMYSRLKGLPAHESMKEMSQLIWETCKTYLTQQG